jgi:hypothetical protein
VDFVYYIDLVAGLTGGIINLFPEVTDIVDTGITGRIDFNNIQCSTFGNCLAHTAGITRFAFAIGQAVDCFSQETSGTGLAGTPGPTKKIGVCHPTALKCVDQCPCDLLLSDKLVESLRTVFTIKNLRTHYAILYPILAVYRKTQGRIFGKESIITFACKLILCES